MFESGKVLYKPWQVAHHKRCGLRLFGLSEQLGSKQARYNPKLHSIAQPQFYQNGSAEQPLPQAWV